MGEGQRRDQSGSPDSMCKCHPVMISEWSGLAEGTGHFGEGNAPPSPAHIRADPGPSVGQGRAGLQGPPWLPSRGLGWGGQCFC